MKTVTMPIQKKWFNMIISGEKKEEYREVKEYWRKRLLHDKVDRLKLINGYGSDKPYIIIELKDIKMGLGNPYHGAPLNVWVYILKLGEIVERGNLKNIEVGVNEERC